MEKKGTEVRIVKQEGSPLIDFAVEEIERAIWEIGLKTKVLQPSEAGGLRGEGIVIAAIDGVAWLAKALEERGIETPDLMPDGFAIRVKDGIIAVVGYDQRGAMYGGLDVAETISLEGAIEFVRDKNEKPFLAFRAIDHAVPLKSKYTLPTVQAERFEWAHNLHYWKKYFDMMAKNRYNAIVLITPFDHMIKNEKYPEATSLTDEELQENINLFKSIIKMANDRGIDVYLMKWWDGWNINYSAEFAEAHGFFKPPLPSGERLPIVDSPLTKDYTKEYVRILLETYPEVKGLCCAPGERMPGCHVEVDPMPATRQRPELVMKDVPYDLQWIKDTWVESIKEAAKKTGGVADFLLRAWWNLPEPCQRIVAADYPGKVYVPLKFNGEHPFSSTKPHYYYDEWLSQKPRDYKIVWELTVTSDMKIFRWGDPEFVKEYVNSMGAEFSAGAKMPTAERGKGGPDIEHSNAYGAHVTWNYLFQKHWFADMLWGRLAYNPETSEETWIKYFIKRFGAGGEDAYRALVQASRILPTTTCFHWNYMDGDWVVEFCIGGWNTAEMRGGGVGNYREWWWRDPTKKFHSILEWIFNHTIDEEWLTIREYVNLVAAGKQVPEGKITPIDVADRLEGYSNQALKNIEKAASRVTEGKEEFECLELDVKAVAYLGLYYAEKTRGATELMFFLRKGEDEHQEKAIQHLWKAAKWWSKLCDTASPHYANAIAHGQYPARWENYKGDVERDISVARQLGYNTCPIW